MLKFRCQSSLCVCTRPHLRPHPYTKSQNNHMILRVKARAHTCMCVWVIDVPKWMCMCSWHDINKVVYPMCFSSKWWPSQQKYHSYCYSFFSHQSRSQTKCDVWKYYKKKTKGGKNMRKKSSLVYHFLFAHKNIKTQINAHCWRSSQSSYYYKWAKIYVCVFFLLSLGVLRAFKNSVKCSERENDCMNICFGTFLIEIF